MENDNLEINEFMEKLVSVLNAKFSEIEKTLDALRTDMNRLRIDTNDTKDDLTSLESRIRTEINALRDKMETEKPDTKINKDILDALER